VELTTELLTTRHVSTGTVENVYRDLGAGAAIEVPMVINRWADLVLMLNALEVDLDKIERLELPTARGSGRNSEPA
jgi:hypothetical protein